MVNELDKSDVAGFVSFEDIQVNGENCYYENEDYQLILRSFSSLRDVVNIKDPLNLTYEATETISMAGYDKALRKCGEYEDSFTPMYYFIEDITVFWNDVDDAFFPNRSQFSISDIMGKKFWMVSFRFDQKEPQRVCLFLEQSFSLNSDSENSEPTVTPEPDANEEDTSDDDSGDDQESSTGPPTNNTFPEAAEEGEKEEDEKESSGSCFPSDVTVHLSNGLIKRMDQVDLHDEIQVGVNEFSPVFTFTHREYNSYHQFTSLLTRSGKELIATSSHIIYLGDGRMIAVRHVQVGDSVILDNGTSDNVVAVRKSLRKGLFNPQTLHGDIIVNEVRASTYTESVRPSAAHGMLTVLRMVYRFVGWTWSGFQSGAPSSMEAWLPHS